MNPDSHIAIGIIIRAFVKVRRVLLRQNDLKEQMKELKDRIGGHDAQLNQIYDAL